MADHSKIEWCNATWNPVRGCTKVSPGCRSCYAETFAERFRGVKGHPYEQGFDLRLVPEKLEEPLRWKRPRRIFVNSMSDLFQDGVPDQFIHDVYYTMESRAPQHIYQVLTKRSNRMRAYLDWRYGEGRIPSKHIWHGVSVENRAMACRLDDLREMRSAIRFVSIEPLLEDIGDLDLRGIHWVIVGGESGPQARPFQVEWARSIIAQCKAAGVACFIKQVGSRPEGWWTNSLGPGFNRHAIRHHKGGNIVEWSPDLRVREYPSC